MYVRKLCTMSGCHSKACIKGFCKKHHNMLHGRDYDGGYSRDEQFETPEYKKEMLSRIAAMKAGQLE